MASPPAGYSSPADRAIRDAMDRGAFDNLPGAGRPLPASATRTGTDAILLRYLESGDGANSGFLPPSLLLRREAEDLPDRAARLRTEQAVRDLVADLNRRIRDEIRMPTWGPPLAMRPVDIDEVLTRWRADRQAIADRQAADARAIQQARAAQRPSRHRRGGVRDWLARRRGTGAA